MGSLRKEAPRDPRLPVSQASGSVTDSSISGSTISWKYHFMGLSQLIAASVAEETSGGLR